MKIKITTPSRLHFGLIDLNGDLGRINGGLGVALNNPRWIIEGVFGSASERKPKLSDEFQNEFDVVRHLFDEKFKCNSSAINFDIQEQITSHVGLGSKTQFLLAISTILNKMHNLSFSTRELATIIKRGGTSGIGVAAFEAGGFILDGGHTFGPGKETESFLPSSKSVARPAPVIFQKNPPENWYFVVLTPKNMKGSFGSEEVALFQEQCPIDSSEVEKISRLILMKILPAIVENDIATFGTGLTELQTKFTRFGMEKYDGTIVNELLQYLGKHSDSFGSGISSFGPTVFSLTNNKEKALKILAQISENYSTKKFDLLIISQINKTGALIEIQK
ncbi:MAG: beta-ribofuranosylaminobenzene 5'-phosphate synthase family protein [Candidatus Heimdallarchaeota archaeon]